MALNKEAIAIDTPNEVRRVAIPAVATLALLAIGAPETAALAAGAFILVWGHRTLFQGNKKK